VLGVFVDHYNTHRPHRSLGSRPAGSERSKTPRRDLKRRDRLGGLIHEYTNAA
jgi:putative transposase